MRFGSVNLLSGESVNLFSGEIEARDRSTLKVAFYFELVPIAVKQFQSRARVGQPCAVVCDLRLIRGSGVCNSKGVEFVETPGDFNGDVTALDRRRDAMFDCVFNERLQSQAGKVSDVTVWRRLAAEVEPRAEAELFEFEVRADDFDLGIEGRRFQSRVGQNSAVEVREFVCGLGRVLLS